LLLMAREVGLEPLQVACELETRKGGLDRMLAEVVAPPPLLHPSLSEVYRTRIHSLSEALGLEDTREEAAQIVRALVSEIELTPEKGRAGDRIAWRFSGDAELRGAQQKARHSHSGGRAI
jgi:hypothetical protein